MTSNVLLANLVKRAAGQCFSAPLFRCLSSHQSIFQVCCLSTSQSQPGLCLWGSTWDHLLQKNRKIQPPKPAQNGDMCGSWKTSRHEWNRSAPQRCDSTWHWRFCGPNDLSYPMLFCCFCHLKKMKYSSIALYTKSCWRHCVWISPPILWRYICYSATTIYSLCMLDPFSKAWLSRPDFHGKMAILHETGNLQNRRTEEPKNRTSTNACTKAAMPGKWCRDADGRTDTTRHPPLIILK